MKPDRLVRVGGENPREDAGYKSDDDDPENPNCCLAMFHPWLKLNVLIGSLWRNQDAAKAFVGWLG